MLKDENIQEETTSLFGRASQYTTHRAKSL